MLDYKTRQPIQASLSVKLPTGRVLLGQSAEGSGQFRIDLDCRATVLIIEHTGYHTQQLSLSNLSANRSAVVFGVLIPLVALDKQGVDQLYQQSAQRHYEQQGSPKMGMPQRGLFTVTDALTNSPLRVKACLFSTNEQTKRCFDTDSKGLFRASFSKQDIVALEIQQSGYLPYQGNIVIEQLDGQQRTHSIKLLRELTVVSIQIPQGQQKVNGELQSVRDNTTTPLQSVPGVDNQLCTYMIQPGQYKLTAKHTTGVARYSQPLTIRTGLNVIALPAIAPPPNISAGAATSTARPHLTVSPKRVYRLPDELPLIYFEQGSYLLDEEDRDLLRQVGVFMQTHPEYRLKIIGHTDPEGDEQINRYLSELRARMISNFLLWQGVPEKKMAWSGQGSRYPISPRDTEENKAKNRRVFLKLEIDQ
ncbi:OmpA family protein [Rudanella paleaurantiibacter]|uniref:OmpA family protein n=1 Tax=Rudanella paleaurantiibacter TaxID=2614655 RepID=A0A7J5TVS6_9BACT|nr:OmpA family protein [Rudanella paleaurantiibacter]KAB7728389.1 OmpA family protein [Rudanella paleaurantiibacter]